MVTSFDSIGKVTLAKHVLKPLESLCKATGTCDYVRQTLFAPNREYLDGYHSPPPAQGSSSLVAIAVAAQAAVMAAAVAYRTMSSKA